MINSHIIETDPTVISELVTAIPEFTKKNSPSEIKDRCDNRQPKYWCYMIGDSMAGFLVGYALDDVTYYNWIMGVLPEFRKRGCGWQMLDYFETYVAYHGFRKCAVKSMNQYRSMLSLLIRKHYDIISVGSDGKIYFEKGIE